LKIFAHKSQNQSHKLDHQKNPRKTAVTMTETKKKNLKENITTLALGSGCNYGKGRGRVRGEYNW
jgi:hypothetical protein